MYTISKAAPESIEMLEASSLIASVFSINPQRKNTADYFQQRIEKTSFVSVAQTQNAKIVGAVIMSKDSWLKNRYCINWVAVKAEHRQKGIGSSLIKACEEEAFQAGNCRIELFSTIGNGHMLYRRLGYETDLTDRALKDACGALFYKNLVKSSL